MSGRRKASAVRIGGVAAAVGLVVSSAAVAGDPSAAALRGQSSVLESRTHRALLDLYALDMRLQSVRSRLTTLRARALELRHDQAALMQRVSATQHTLELSQQRLGANLRLLYKQDDTSTLAVVLGARSIDDALTRIDDLRSVADQGGRMLETTTAARARLAQLQATLSRHRAQIEHAVATTRETANALVSARAERVAFIARLRTQARSNTTRIRTLVTAARRVVQTSQQLEVAAATTQPLVYRSLAIPDNPFDAAAASATPGVPSGGQEMTVVSTGYSMSGRTATGMPVGWGIVAVDPALIPLGTRVTIPGYGEAVAADTGGGVVGATIDVWFPTPAEAHAWGRRTVTITLH